MCLSESFAKIGLPDLPIISCDSFSFRCLDGLIFVELRLALDVWCGYLYKPELKVCFTIEENACTYWWGLYKYCNQKNTNDLHYCVILILCRLKESLLSSKKLVLVWLHSERLIGVVTRRSQVWAQMPILGFSETECFSRSRVVFTVCINLWMLDSTALLCRPWLTL